MSLRKFPVTASDGTEFRVTIREIEDDMFYGDYALVKLYVKRRCFGFRKVFFERYLDDKRVYDRAIPDYVKMASLTVGRYYADSERRVRRARVLDEIEQQRQDARQRFAEWDGRLTK